ncbi:MAG: hypothetical protein ACLGH3_07010 [Actinomycetota bacterium]
MKRFAISLLVAAAAFTAAPASAEEPAQEVSGTVLLPTVNVPTVGYLSRQARCVYTTDASLNGITGYVIELNSIGDGTQDFTLTSPDADPGVIFYESLGTCDNAPAPVTVQPDDFVTEGDEAGKVPFGAQYAIVMQEGAVDGAFTFTVL